MVGILEDHSRDNNPTPKSLRLGQKTMQGVGTSGKGSGVWIWGVLGGARSQAMTNLERDAEFGLSTTLSKSLDLLNFTRTLKFSSFKYGTTSSPFLEF